MLSTHLKFSLRSLWNNRLYTLVTLFGIAVGITCMQLAILYAEDERRFDTFHSDRLFRITMTMAERSGTSPVTTGGTGQVQGPAFGARVPGIQAFTRVMGGDIYGDVRGPRGVHKLQLLYVDANFLQLFHFPILQGSAATALKDINAVVLTERTALKYFGTIQAVGRTLRIDDDPSAQKIGKPLVVTAVVQNPPAQSSLQFDLLHPFAFLQVSFEDPGWFNAYLSTFLRLEDQANPASLEKTFDQVHRRLAGPGTAVHYGLQPLTDIHLNPLYNAQGNREGGVVNAGSALYSYLLLGIAGIILAMAGMNFLTINLAHSLKRTREIGLLQIAGSTRAQVLFRFLTESALLSLLAFGLALLLTELALPVFNALSGKQVTLYDAWHPQTLLLFAGLLLIVILLTGIYPFLALSRFRIAELIRRNPVFSGKKQPGRILLVTQLALSVGLGLATLVFERQMAFIRTKDLGYDPSHIIRTNVRGNRDAREVIPALERELRQEPAIAGISYGQEFGNTTLDIRANGQTIRSLYQIADDRYVPLLGLQLKEGRNFTGSEVPQVLVNESFVRAAGLRQPVGALIRDPQFGRGPSRIAGVLADFHVGSLKNRISPLVLFAASGYQPGIWVKAAPGRQAEAVAALGRSYRKVLPQTLFDYQFLSDLVASPYAQDRRWQQITGYAALLSVFICGSGLFALITFAARQRTREIGIRKVLGASVWNLVALLSRDFLRLTALAFLLAAPLAWYLMSFWLNQFAYRIPLEGSLFALTGAGALLLTFLIVGLRGLLAAYADPVKNLKTE
jgi:putative ABC transport system permease protein